MFIMIDLKRIKRKLTYDKKTFFYFKIKNRGYKASILIDFSQK